MTESIYGITNPDAFNEKEWHHIRSLFLEMSKLQSDIRGGQRLTSRKRDLLDSYIWLFRLLDEISMEELER